MKSQRGYTLIGLFYLLIVISGTIGWFLNLYKIAISDFSILTGMLVLRVVGIFIAPIGAVLGFF